MARATRPARTEPKSVATRRPDPARSRSVTRVCSWTVAPVLHAALSRAEDWPLLPEDLRGYLALLHGQNRIRNRRLRRQAGILPRQHQQLLFWPKNTNNNFTIVFVVYYALISKDIL